MQLFQNGKVQSGADKKKQFIKLSNTGYQKKHVVDLKFFFFEIYNKKRMLQKLIDMQFVQGLLSKIWLFSNKFVSFFTN